MSVFARAVVIEEEDAKESGSAAAGEHGGWDGAGGSAVAFPDQLTSEVATEVRRGLSRTPKELSPWLFYDAAGSELFEQITALPEYYLTRTERAILQRHADEIVGAAAADGTSIGTRVNLIELGAGSGAKTQILMRALGRKQGTLDYYPIDVSATALAEAQERLEEKLPYVTVHPRVENFTEGFAELPDGGVRRFVIWIGSSIGNFDPEQAAGVLRKLRERLVEGDQLLLGADNAKPEEALIAAYNDAAGVTAAFNLNLLTRLNRELGSDFKLGDFEHRAIWNAEQSRVEMHLISRVDQTVAIPGAAMEVRFRAGESIHTENSYKFTRAKVENLLRRAGFALEQTWSDEREWFGVYLGKVS